MSKVQTKPLVYVKGMGFVMVFLMIYGTITLIQQIQSWIPTQYWPHALLVAITLGVLGGVGVGIFALFQYVKQVQMGYLKLLCMGVLFRLQRTKSLSQLGGTSNELDARLSHCAVLFSQGSEGDAITYFIPRIQGISDGSEVPVDHMMAIGTTMDRLRSGGVDVRLLVPTIPSTTFRPVVSSFQVTTSAFPLPLAIFSSN